jgi:hypothetical protein
LKKKLIFNKIIEIRFQHFQGWFLRLGIYSQNLLTHRCTDFITKQPNTQRTHINMNFFGLTYLGPPSTFAPTVLTSASLVDFTNEQLTAAFHQFPTRLFGFIDADEIQIFMTKVRGF